MGFAVFGDAVYMNGAFNGRGGLSHRARIPNWAGIVVGGNVDDHKSQFILNAKTGVFQRDVVVVANDSGGGCCYYKIIHRVYAHRYFNRAIINQVSLHRHTMDGKQESERWDSFFFFIDFERANLSHENRFERTRVCVLLQNQKRMQEMAAIGFFLHTYLQFFFRMSDNEFAEQ